MSWAKVDDGLHDHPKVDAMLEANELHGAAALGLWVAALSYSADQLTDGVVSRRAVLRMFPEHGAELAALLVKHDLWDATDGGWQIRGFLDCNPGRDEVLAKRRADAERKAAARARGESKRTSARTSARTTDGVRPDVPPESAQPSEHPVPSRPDPSRPEPEPESERSGSTNARATPSLSTSRRTDVLRAPGGDDEEEVRDQVRSTIRDSLARSGASINGEAA